MAVCVEEVGRKRKKDVQLSQNTWFGRFVIDGRRWAWQKPEEKHENRCEGVCLFKKLYLFIFFPRHFCNRESERVREERM